jgi:hypothetical protein
METDPDTLQKLIENAKPFQWFPQRTHEIFCLGAFRSMSGVALILFSLAPVEAESEDELIAYVNEIIAGGGKLLIPELGLGRAQETMLVIEDAIKNGTQEDINQLSVQLSATALLLESEAN